MSEWRLSSLAELIVPIESGKRPRGGADTENDGIPSIGGENITRDGTLNFEIINRVPKRFALSMRKGWLCAGDGLINKDGAQTGKVALYRGEFEEATVNEHVFIPRARDVIVDSQFLFFQLFRTDVQMQIAARITGSAQPGLGSSFVDHVYIHHPEDMAAQKALAAQVQTVWSEITHTEALIAKQEQVRAGLMQDLFTRGVDETGRLRPPREEAPELYHETPMGWLPMGWEAAFLSERAPSCGGHLKTGPFGSSLKISHWVETGHPVITIGSLGVGCFIQDELLFVGAETARRLEGYRVAPGDIVFQRVADVGRSVVVDEASDGWIISSNLMRLRVDSTN